MPTKTSVQNNFTKGLLTEFSGLNFPENACTETVNCKFLRTGSVTRRLGLDYEVGFVLTAIDRTNMAISTYRWLNAGGDGSTQILVVQIGTKLYFFESSSANTSSPLSSQRLTSIVQIPVSDPSLECQYTDGNGYLFVFHPATDPFYCTLSNGVVASNRINIKIRDFVGDIEPGVPDNNRPHTLTNNHKYNLQNQGWVSGGVQWSTHSGSTIFYQFQEPISETFAVDAGLPVQPGDLVTAQALVGLFFWDSGQTFGTLALNGVVVNYAGTTMTINFTGGNQFSTPAFAATGPPYTAFASNSWQITPTPSGGDINTWFTTVGNYPSNADVWWQFKDTTNNFNPALTIGQVTLNSGPAPKGYYILDAFAQDRTTASSIPGFNIISTTKRPRTGAWFQGRVWYTGVDDSVFTTDTPGGNPLFYTWTENIYFSQIITNTSQFGKCHQANDPTSQDLFDLLPTDGGVIQIQGCGAIYKLFPIQNGMLVFAANGIWLITGSSAVGFAANDYTITKISGVECLSSTSFINVQGLPMFWNEEDIYYVTPSAQDKRNNEQLGLTVTPLTLQTIKSFYGTIPTSSKKFARGSYNPITNIVQWVYRSTESIDTSSKYEFDSILNFNTLTQAFYPWTVLQTTNVPVIHDVTYIISPGGTNAPDPTFKYLTSAFYTLFGHQFTFSEERDPAFVDWNSSGNAVNFISDFTTGYSLHGDAIRKWQPEYTFVYQNLNPLVASIPQPIPPPQFPPLLPPTGPPVIPPPVPPAFNILSVITNSIWTNTPSSTVTMNLVANTIVLVYAHQSQLSTNETLTISSPNLTFTRRATNNRNDSGSGGSNVHQEMEVWWAPVNVTLSGEVITATSTHSVSTGSIIGVNMSGSFKLTNPWDINFTLPATSQTLGGVTPPNITSVSTTDANTILFWVFGGSQATSSQDASWTIIANTSNTTFITNSEMHLGYQRFNVTQNNATYTGLDPCFNWMTIADAIAL